MLCQPADAAGCGGVSDEESPPALTIVASRLVCFEHGYDSQGTPSQVTLVQLGTATGYVREARRASSEEHFLLSSGARLGHKADANRIGREVLELAAAGAAWPAIAAAVRALDSLKRDVLRSPRWSLELAMALWASDRGKAHDKPERCTECGRWGYHLATCSRSRTSAVREPREHVQHEQLELALTNGAPNARGLEHEHARTRGKRGRMP